MDFMAHHELSARIFSRGLHAHDFYELYFHLGGARYYCIDDTIYELQPNQFILIPPLHMHGLVCDRDLVDYERCYLYLSTELLMWLWKNRPDSSLRKSLSGQKNSAKSLLRGYRTMQRTTAIY